MFKYKQGDIVNQSFSKDIGPVKLLHLVNKLDWTGKLIWLVEYIKTGHKQEFSESWFKEVIKSKKNFLPEWL